MAGSADDEENPVVVNVVPLIDILFCICIFFFCTFHFKELEGKIESWLPKGFGDGGVPVDELRIIMKWDDARKATTRQVGANSYPDDNQLQQAILASYADLQKMGKVDASVIIDAGLPEGRKTPWQDVVTVMDLCKAGGIQKIEFVAPVGYAMPK